MSKYWSDTARSIKPYIPGEQPKDRRYIKLNTNENPYPPSPEVIKAIRELADERLRLYPDPNGEELCTALAKAYKRDRKEVFIGNGSDEVLAFAFMAFFDPGKPILFPDISYSFYRVYAKLYHLDFELIPLNEDFSIPLSGFLKENGGIVIANPNAPTGRVLPISDIKTILEHNEDRVVIIDEAYVDFGGESAVELIEDYPNLLVIQTFSKSRSLAGLRIGYAFGQTELIEGLNRIKNSFNSYTLDRLALAAACRAVEDDFYFRETLQKVIKTREWTVQSLERLGFRVVPSKTNFVFASHPDFPAEQLFRGLRDRGILVRYFKEPRIDQHLRISIGSDQEMECLIKELTTLTFAEEQ